MIAELAKTALVGLGKQARAPEDDTPLAELPSPATLTQESALLVRAGLHAVARTVGKRPLASVAAPTPAPPESIRSWTPWLTTLFADALEDRGSGLFDLFADRLAKSQLTLPPELLPIALAAGAQSRTALEPLLGARGRWLAALNPAWKWAIGGTATDVASCQRQFDEGTPAERAAALRTLRELDPTAARAALAAVLPNEKADQRALFAASLSVGLSLADEPLLESLLDDRSEQVRQAAASLLLRLPDSRLVQRITKRADDMVTLKGAGKKTVSANPPHELDAEWQRDGIAKTPPHGLGKRAYWTEVVVAAVPLAYWTTKFGVAPAALVEGASEEEFGEHVVVGWTEAFARRLGEPSEAWFAALWNYWEDVAQSQRKNADAGIAHCERLLGAARGELGEARLGPLLDRTQYRSERWAHMAAKLPRPWSAEFAKKYWAAARPAVLCADERAYDWALTLPTAALAMPTATLHEFALPWNVAINEKLGWRRSAIEKMVANACDAARRRHEFEAELTKTLGNRPER